MPQASDIEIAQAASMRPIVELARERLGIDAADLEPFGHYKAKLSFELLERAAARQPGTLILVTAMSPTPAGEGKTTTTVGLGDAMNRLGHRTLMCLREPSLGPVFGFKGGAAGGGHAQIVPMEDINLHFTGDFGAIQLANNLLAAMLDNHLQQGNALGIDLRRITWRRVLDLNDRVLRQIVVGLGGPGNGFPREGGFDIVAASEVMAVLCLANSLEDLRQRLGDIVVGYTHEQRPVTARELGAQGAMTVLLRDALKPNLVQTLENNPALVHGGPFGNIAHGCNSAIATRAALGLADFVVTEAGFGADLGAEKFIDIKCRSAGLAPAAAVIVATVRALKYHGGVALDALTQPDPGAVEKGLANLERHIENVRHVYGLPCVVSLNRFESDSDQEVAVVRSAMQALQVPMAPATHWSDGGQGAIELARMVVDACMTPSPMRLLYEDELPLWDKIGAVARRVYRASEVTADTKVRAAIRKLQADGFGHLPVCIAKTQSSFSTDPKLRGAPENHVLNVREVRLAAGARFVIALCGDILTMPGLPAVPAATRIDLVDGRVVGLF
ncbi:MAG: formate--tetrahydrofolate ligase [Burkholderiales bacterium]|nr:MAG: formate--tetrahydrofolate ligase [Burkholderiales bacterium]